MLRSNVIIYDKVAVLFIFDFQRENPAREQEGNAICEYQRKIFEQDSIDEPAENAGNKDEICPKRNILRSFCFECFERLGNI